MLDFGKLWDEHPYIKDAGVPPCIDKQGKPNFDNQCAVRMGVALGRVVMNLKSYRGVRCWHGHKDHILRAEELASWFLKQTIQLGTVSIKKSTSHVRFIGKKGLVFFKDGWPRGGDHIDVWNAASLGGGHLGYFALAKQVWFWQLA